MSVLWRGAILLRRVLDLLLVVLIVLVLAGVALGRIAPLTGRTTLIIRGGSMEPAIPIGSAIVVEPVDPATLNVGEGVSLRSGPNLQSVFTHRITRLVDRADGRWIETKGDANEAIDPSITPSRQIIGRAVLTVPAAGYLLRLLAAPSGVLLVALLAGVILVALWLLESLDGDRRPSPPRSDAAGGPADEPAGDGLLVGQ